MFSVGQARILTTSFTPQRRLSLNHEQRLNDHRLSDGHPADPKPYSTAREMRQEFSNPRQYHVNHDAHSGIFKSSQCACSFGPFNTRSNGKATSTATPADPAVTLAATAATLQNGMYLWTRSLNLAFCRQILAHERIRKLPSSSGKQSPFDTLFAVYCGL